jgi:putative FmdB family regulatory protein
MPTYTYRCNKCGDESEVFQSMSDPPLKRCKKCRGALRRTLHPVGIVLKGSGFYKTDHRSKSESAARKESSETSEKSQTSEKKVETSEKKVETSDSSKSETKASAPDSKAKSDS